jgi:hypothetical protein
MSVAGGPAREPPEGQGPGLDVADAGAPYVLGRVVPGIC